MLSTDFLPPDDEFVAKLALMIYAAGDPMNDPLARWKTLSASDQGYYLVVAKAIMSYVVPHVGASALLGAMDSVAALAEENTAPQTTDAFIEWLFRAARSVYTA